MNRPPETFVSVQEDRLLTFSTACFEKAGLSHDHAALISRLPRQLRHAWGAESRNANRQWLL